MRQHPWTLMLNRSTSMNIYDPIAITLGIPQTIDVKDYPNIEDIPKTCASNVSGVRKGARHSEESKLLMSKSRKGKCTGSNNPMYGKKHSNKIKQEHSKRMKGRLIGANNGMYGSKRSDLAERNKAGRGKHWYTDGVTSKQYFPHEVPNGWHRGRI